MGNDQTQSEIDKDEGPMDARDLLEEVILAIIDNPAEMCVTEISEPNDPHKRILQVQVGAEDRGKVIGKGGVIAQKLRSLFGLIGQRTNTNIEVRIDGGPDHKPRPRSHHMGEGYIPGRQQQFYPQQMMLVPAPPGYFPHHQPRFNGNGQNRNHQGFQHDRNGPRRPPRG